MLLLSKYVNSIFLNNLKRSFPTKSYRLICSKKHQVANNNNNKQYVPIFKTSNMAVLIGLNRIKKFQTAALFCLIPTCFGLNMLSCLSLEEVLCASLIGFGLTSGLHIASWLLSNNLVVFVYLCNDEQKCRMSYVSYWGNREELFCDIEDIIPIKCSKLDLLNHKIKIKGNKNTFKIATRDAFIYNNAKFRKVFGSDVI